MNNSVDSKLEISVVNNDTSIHNPYYLTGHNICVGHSTAVSQWLLSFVAHSILL